MNNVVNSESNHSTMYYTVIADQIQISPIPLDKVLEIIYYQKLPNLSADEPLNWLSEIAPDVYVFGLLVEISSFVKDATAKDLWDSRFTSAMAEMSQDDSIARWSGTALTVRIG